MPFGGLEGQSPRGVRGSAPILSLPSPVRTGGGSRAGAGIAMKYLWTAIWLLLAAPSWAGDPSALWKEVNEKCVPNMRDAKNPAPCDVVDLAAGYVALKDIVGATQFLLIPATRLAGIETPDILQDGAPNYWDHAWRMRRLTEARAGKALPREALSLAINSAYGRTQDQLHIHIDCVRRDVRDALAAHRDAIDIYWDTFPVRLASQTWRAYRIDGENLGTTDPFRLLAGGSPDAATEMGRHSLVLVGMTWSNGVKGFALLDGRAGLSPPNRGSGEILQDHGCALAR